MQSRMISGFERFVCAVRSLAGPPMNTPILIRASGSGTITTRPCQPVLPALVRSIGSTVDILFETAGSPYLFVQFTDGIQLELSSGRVSEASDRDYGVVVLLDRDGMCDQPYEPGRPWDETLWLGWAWIALSDIDKYLRRGSLWEALTALEKARSLLLRHHAAEIGVRDPQYGVASILDYGGELPDGLESTVARLDAVEVRRAACACAALLSAYGRRPFVEFVLAQLFPC